MAREIHPGIYWIYEDGPDRSGMIESVEPLAPWYDPDEAVRIPQCAYLMVGDDASLLFDTLSPASTEHVLNELADILDEPLDYLVVSHPDIPHAGNTSAIVREHHPEIVAPKYGDDHELYRLDDALLVGEGDSIDLGGFVVDFHEAVFLDAPVSLWMTERTQQMLFPVDWMGFPHKASERLKFVDEIEDDLDGSRLLQFHGRVLFWHQYVDVEKVHRTIDFVKERYDPDWILPTHGLVIRQDADRYMELLKDVIEDIEQRERIGILG